MMLGASQHLCTILIPGRERDILQRRFMSIVENCLNQALTTGMVPLKCDVLLEDSSFLCKPGSRVASPAASSTARLQCTIETPYLVENRIIMYRIAVEFFDQTWYVHRRFQDFMALSDTLKKFYPKELIPKLPSKTLFSNRSEEFVSKRSKVYNNS
ncbi:serine/threonine-protein kinase Sgk3-like [Tropilaelaps mercedesae]|uniref:Serine/threonine-protein kinase Sgk3-like n=1 Tax=Tropilaelaps mercedesae TaxID=418985 RepID=A0A1V9XAG2_9ACAR|nr:serine/threonine-protein kinase Sgk3-like [Tropilaelaps mercedesae]